MPAVREVADELEGLVADDPWLLAKTSAVRWRPRGSSTWSCRTSTEVRGTFSRSRRPAIGFRESAALRIARRPGLRLADDIEAHDERALFELLLPLDLETHAAAYEE
jgi:hypothetical protein